MPELILPTVDLHASWLEARDDWGHDAHQDGSGIHLGQNLDTAEGFAAWVEELRRRSDHTTPLADGFVHANHWWIVENGDYLGAISLRHELNDFLLNAGGHIGYGVRPSARGRGVATWALSAVLDEARQLGLKRVLVTCDDTNVASARTIERAGGELEDTRNTELGYTRRYWINL
ncbi:GNAT family N-acetyltransferase [Kribbella sp. NBC_01245]|uniref:GNAT family N-acetyltransferase n=1 Tax=Kribbella sp. NBC_01245 TaxID=2903578 RepID=UPI002E2A2B0C|nr:GNAT family N-acetyltransferase [Kribbella sp. NBC_01245]